jgi:hypothetical protein
VALAVRGTVAKGLAVSAVALVAFAGGCGGSQRNAHEPKGNYTVEVRRARFLAKQAIARNTEFEMVVRNAGSRTIPNVAVSLDSFSYTSTYPRLAVNKRPVWIVNTGPGAVSARPVESEAVNPPGGGGTAFVNTWALGALAPGASRSFVWHVTPVKAGMYTVHYTVAAGLDGLAHTRLVSGAAPIGKLVARIAPRPPATHVNPQTGAIAAGAPPVSSGPVGAVP